VLLYISFSPHITVLRVEDSVDESSDDSFDECVEVCFAYTVM